MSPLDYAAQIAYSTKETLQLTYDLALKQLEVEGDYVECGVAAGAQIIAILHASGNQKVVHAFDSFEGIPLPSNRDNQMPGIRMLEPDEIKNLPNPGEQELKTSGATVVSVGGFVQHVTLSGVNAESLVIHQGWFEETVSKSKVKKIALLRLDGDLYNSTLVCLQHLFPKVVKGGVVIIDDWELPGCRAACDDYFKSIHYKPDYQIKGVAYFVK